MAFNGKNVFVAGGTTGINLEIARAFCKEGARVSVLSRKAENVESAVESLRQHSASVNGYSADVRDYDAVSQAVTNAAEAWGPIDIVISGAAGNFLAAAASMSANAFKTVVDIDLLGSFNVLRAAYEHLRKPGAAIINITAPQAWLPTPMQAHACAAKAGLDQLTRTLAMEWGPQGIRVNAIAPGPIEETEGLRRLIPTPEIKRALTMAIPCRRCGTTDDVAAAAKWLCSAEASYITGVILPVDGGWSLGGSGSMLGQPQPAST